MSARTIAKDRSVDSTGAFLRQGYAFIGNRCRRLHSDAFQTRLGLEPAVCMLGEDAARTFYSAPVTRSGAMPPSVVSLLQDRGSVQALDGIKHRHRKELLMSLLAPPMARDMAKVVDEEWRRRALQWEQARKVVLREAQPRNLGSREEPCWWPQFERQFAHYIEEIKPRDALGR